MKFLFPFLLACCVLTAWGSPHNEVSEPVEVMTDVLASMMNDYAQVTDTMFWKSSVFECRRYYFALYEVLNVTYAARMCEALGGYLAEVDTAAELRFLQQQAKSVPRVGQVDVFWLGGSDERQEGHWINRRTGKPIGYRGWTRGQPDNALGGEDCQSLCRWSGMKVYMNDVKCHRFRNSPVTPMRYICELPFDHETDSS